MGPFRLQSSTTARQSRSTRSARARKIDPGFQKRLSPRYRSDHRICKFLPPSPEFSSYLLEREAWPRNSASQFSNCRSSRRTSSRNIASTNCSIRGFARLLEARGLNCKACQQTLPPWHMRAPIKRYAMQIFFDIGIPTCHHVFIPVGIYLKERDIL